jgi:hypothetical protein
MEKISFVSIIYSEFNHFLGEMGNFLNSRDPSDTVSDVSEGFFSRIREEGRDILEVLTLGLTAGPDSHIMAEIIADDMEVLRSVWGHIQTGVNDISGAIINRIDRINEAIVDAIFPDHIVDTIGGLVDRVLG